MIRAGFETTDRTQTRTVLVKAAEETGGRGWVLEVHCPVGCTGSKSRSCPRDLGRDVRDPRGDGRVSVGGRAADVEERRERSHAGRRSARPPVEHGGRRDGLPPDQ